MSDQAPSQGSPVIIDGRNLINTAAFARPYRTGGTFFYAAPFVTASIVPIVQNRLYSLPYFVPFDTVFSKIGIRSGNKALSNTRLGIYTDQNGLPNVPILDVQVSTAVSGFHTVNINLFLARGWYWLVAVDQGAAGNLNINTATNLYDSPTSDPATLPAVTGYIQDGVTGTLPNPWGTTFTESGQGLIVHISPK